MLVLALAAEPLAFDLTLVVTGAAVRLGCQVPADWNPEDPHLWVDRRGNWHIVNHAYNPRSVNPLYPHQAHPKYRNCSHP